MLRFTLPPERRLVHEMTMPIRWGDMDAMGHVNNTTYFRYFETARIDWLHAIGGAPDPAGQGPVIVNAFCNFLKQLEYPGQIVARLYVADVGRSSFDTYHELSPLDAPDVVHAEGGARIVWVDFPAQKSCALPDWLRERLA